MGNWRELEHTADVAVQIEAENLRDLFETAATALYSVMACCCEGASVGAQVAIELNALDIEMLLVDWLNELLFHFEVQRWVFVAFQFDCLSPTMLRATAFGTRCGSAMLYVKAATYHDLRVQRTARGYETVVVFDV